VDGKRNLVLQRGGQKGQVRVGQLADLIVPDRDFFACAGDEIADTTSDLTVVGGKVVYGAGDFAHLDDTAPPPAMPDWSPVRRLCRLGRPGRRRRTRVSSEGGYELRLRQ
jgi:hypothetical protein